MRVVGGRWKGRPLAAPAGRDHTRPTTDRVRESIASMVLSELGLSLAGTSVLDAFAGSGAIGFELLSRGARRVTFVDQNRAAIACIKRNASALGVAPGEASVICGDVLRRATGDVAGAPFDIVMLDPPYAMGEDVITRFVDSLARDGKLVDGAVVVYEHDASSNGIDAARVAGLRCVRARCHGKTACDLLRFEVESPVDDTVESMPTNAQPAASTQETPRSDQSQSTASIDASLDRRRSTCPQHGSLLRPTTAHARATTVPGNTSAPLKSDGMAHVVVPGTFDPPTLGHLDVIVRAARLFDHVTVGVAASAVKNGVGTVFTLDERVALVSEMLADAGIDDVDVAPFTGLLMDFCHGVGASGVVKGLRAMTDFEYELQQADLNRRLGPDVESVFVMSSPEYGYVSSSIVRELAALGSDVSFLVPTCVGEALHERFPFGAR